MKTKKIDLKALLAEKTEGIEPSPKAKETIRAAEKKLPKNLVFDSESVEFRPETVSNGSELAVRPLSVEETKMFEAKINECIEQIFVEGVHYGYVPGVKKKFIFKAGCEVILSMMGLVARTEIIDKVEDYINGIFSYTCKTWLISSYTGSVCAEGYGICNSKENKFLKMNPFNIVNILVQLSRKRSINCATLSVASLSNKFTLDEDLVEPVDEWKPSGNNYDESNGHRKASSKQIQYLERLMQKHNTAISAMNKYVNEHYNVDDYRNISSTEASELIKKFEAVTE